MKILLFFQAFSIWFKTLLRELANNLISVVFILTIYLALWHFPQTVDLLLILNQADAFFLEVPLYFASLVIAAFIIWNAPKYFYYHNYKHITFKNLIGFVPNQHYDYQDWSDSVSYSYANKIHLRKILPRILALLLLSISALSILNAMELVGLNNSYTQLLDPSVSLVVIVIVFLLLSEPRLYKALQKSVKKTPGLNIILPVIVVLLLGLIVSLGTLNTQAEKDLGKLFLSNCALVLLFFSLSFNSYYFLKRVPKRFFYGTIIIAGFLIVFGIIFLNFNPDLSNLINPLSILVFALLAIFMVCFVLILIGKKIKLPLLTIVVLLSLFSSRFITNDSDHYQIGLVDSKINRPPIELYFKKWIKSRSELIMNHPGKFPVISVSSEGGGSRAGLWAFLVNSYLYEQSEGRYYTDHLLSLTGASGGSVGNAMFFAEARISQERNTIAEYTKSGTKEDVILKYKSSNIYKENYLSASLLSLLGRDLFKEITSLFNFRNRGQVLEDQWSQAFEKQFRENQDKEYLKNNYLDFYKDINLSDSIPEIKKVPPLLFVNITHTQTGNYNIISPVTYDGMRPLAGMNDFFTLLQSSFPQKSIALSTAMRMNASFPYVTPVGELRNLQNRDEIIVDQYADAGYYDNIGGRVSKGVEDIFLRILRTDFPELENKIQFIQLQIANEEERKITKTETQLSAPLATLANVRYGHTKEIMERLGDKYVINLKPTAIFSQLTPSFIEKNSEEEENSIKPVLPLGRYLSTVAIRSMEARLFELKPELDGIIK